MIGFPECKHHRRKKCGTTKAGTQRFKCLDCGKKFTAGTKALDRMRVGLDKAAQILGMLCEGMSVRAAARLTNSDPHTVIDLLLLVGWRCQEFLTKTIRGLHVDDVQVDEVWQYIYAKEAQASDLRTDQFTGYRDRIGDSWTYTAIERNTKLLIAWHMGNRQQDDTNVFIGKLRDATTGSFHLSTDGLQNYKYAVPAILTGRVDYGMLIKIFGKSTSEDRRQYSPAPIVGARKESVMGNPDEDKVCTSHTERHNGSMRLVLKRMNRLTYAFSKKWDNHEAALGLYFVHYNFCRKHASLKGSTPAMASGLTDHVWSIEELMAAVGTT
jgi:transposase-like protein/IS1 family transposase